MAKLSRKILVTDIDAIRVRLDGEKVEIVLIEEGGAVQLVPVPMEAEKPRVAA